MNFDLVRLSDDDRKRLKEASEILMEAGETYLAGRLAGLSGRVPANMMTDDEIEIEIV